MCELWVMLYLILYQVFCWRVVWFSAVVIFLAALDIAFIKHAYHSTLTKGASVQLVFGFEVNKYRDFQFIWPLLNTRNSLASDCFSPVRHSVDDGNARVRQVRASHGRHRERAAVRKQGGVSASCRTYSRQVSLISSTIHNVDKQFITSRFK